MDPHRARVRTKRLKGPKPDWGRLWADLRSIYVTAGRNRDVAVLDNFSNRKEKILRKLNVVCRGDILRISKSLRSESPGRETRR